MTWERLRRVIALPFRFPALLAVSVGYSGLLYVVSSKAGFLDVRNPYWVLSVGGVLLLSPIYHAVLLPAIAAALRGGRADWRAVLGEGQNLFQRLFYGEIVVGAAVIAGGLLLLIPGIYIGMRFVYYKQTIVLERTSTITALRKSLRVTRDGRLTFWLFVGLAALYGCAVGFDALLVNLAPMPVVHVGAVVGTGLLLTWMNVLVTSTYVDRADDA